MAKEDTGTTSAAEGKLKALQAAMSKIEKDFGKGSIMRMGDEQIEQVEVIPTGSVALDTALGVGGYPRVESLRFMVQKVLVRLHWLFTLLQRHRSRAVLQPSLMLSTPSTVSMQRS